MPISYRAAQNLIKRGSEEELRVAVQNGLDVNLSNENGWSLLMLAAVEGSSPIVRFLLSMGADPTKTNSKGDSAEMISARRGYDELALLLREAALEQAAG